MFNLIVSGRVDNDRRGLIMSQRVFQHTLPDVESRFIKDGEIDFDSVIKLPTLLMEEGQGDEVARIARLSRVTRKGSDYQLDYYVDPNLPRLTNSQIKEFQADIDMDDWEFQTNHWAIKDVDLFEILLRNSRSQGAVPTVFSLSEKPVNAKLVSFMMPFSGAFTQVYQDAKAILEADGYQCQRADDIWVSSHVMTDIIELICTSAVIVCDLSDRNPNVFYEAGIAHTLGKEVILITQSQDDVPFDVRPIRYLEYHNNGEGRAKLAEALLGRVRTVT